MNTQVIIALIIVILGIGGFWYVKTTNNNDVMEADKMMNDEAMMDGVMEKEKTGVMDSMEDEMTDDTESMMNEGKDMMLGETGGSYEEYAPEKLAFAKSGKVVLFFRASWCPTCAALHKDITYSLDAIPENVLILDVNYDTETALKQKYGVTYQHTFVQVDADGNVIKKWSGSENLKKLVAEIQ